MVIEVRAVSDEVLEPRPHRGGVTHRVLSTGDPVGYPLDALIPDVRWKIEDDETLLINELNVNPPGEDAPEEYLELSGRPGLTLEDTYLLVIDGDSSDEPGTLDFAYRSEWRR